MWKPGDYQSIPLVTQADIYLRLQIRHFVSKLGTYSHQPDAKLRQISLTHNFRSRKEVLEAVNYVFQQVMTRQAAEIDYTEGDFLTGGAQWYEDGQAPSSKNPVELYLLDTSAAQSTALEDESSDVAITAMEQEARFIAGRIHQLIEGGYLVFDNKTKKSRPLEYGDIAILLRSPSRAAETVRQVLQQQGIPARSLAGGQLFDGPETRLLVALLELIDNGRLGPQLASVLLSPIGGFSVEEIAQIKADHPEAELADALQAYGESGSALGEKVKDFLDKLADCRVGQLGPPI